MFRRISLVVVTSVMFSTLVSFPSNAMSPQSSATSTTAYSDMEIMFAQAMIPHHRQAITMSGYALKNSSNADVIDLAKKIIAVQKVEIAQLTSWIKRSGQSMTSDHSMGMSGMLSPTQVTQLKGLKGKAFDRAFLKAMVEHHSGALQMVSWISTSTRSDVKAMAVNIKKAQTTEIAAMKKMIAKLGK
ncbi:MAG: DUF305 domain-containing protein [Candidatus Nanopelagicaceae bacterium]|nr:DUF305 domain-containing protein [Candidatus Nanopelagicaceae bacterium]